MASDSSATGHIRTYIVDDHPAIRDAIRHVIEEAIDMEVCGETGSAEVALREVEERRPDVMIVDISLEDGHGIRLIENVTARWPDIEAVVFSMYDETVYAERAIRAGASGYLMKDQSTRKIEEAIRTAREGSIYLSRKMASRVLGSIGRGGDSGPTFAIDELTGREMDVFRMLGRGYTVEEIQDRLGLAQKTVEAYRRRAKEKLGFDTVPELLQYAVQWTYGRGARPENAGDGAPQRIPAKQ